MTSGAGVPGRAWQRMVEVLAAVVEAELALLESEVERLGVHAAEACEACLGVAPEALDAVDVVAAHAAAAELVGRVIHPEVLLVAHVDQAVVALEPSEWMTERRSTFPRIAGRIVGVEQSSTTSV